MTISSTDQHYIDVLIAGAGPTGSTLAADLLRRGLRVRLVDKAAHAFKGSRAKGVQPRTQEVFEDLGVLEEAHKEGGPYPLVGLHIGPITIPWRMQKQSKPTPDVPYPNILLLSQHRTNAILHRLLERQGLCIEFDTSVEDFKQDADGVTVTLSTGEQVRSRYLVGADGGSSTVRKVLGTRFIGETDDSDRMIIIDGTIDGLSRKRWHMWPRIQGKSVAACPLPHSNQFQIMIKLSPDETPDLNNAALAAYFRKLTGLRLSDITWSSVFRPNVRLAEHYRSGRVFVAGDAAHVHTPAGAQGLNTGVQDAYNLGWKLSQVIAGAPESLLDSYENERLPVAAFVLGKSNELYSGLKQHRLSSLKRGDDERQLGITYHGGALAPADASATKTLRVGDRAPDSSCIGPDGTRRLFDIYQGPHFTLLAFGANATKALHELTWPSTGAKLHRYFVGTSDSVDDNCIIDNTGDLNRIYGITGDTLVLIRPDGYIGSIITEDWHAAFDTAVKKLAPPVSVGNISSPIFSK
ncbi:FAD-dependent monooxygenase [Paenibacillus sp. 453mf]|uniref:FAD-dependent monooxygenase n=1 Tax=Paenibacillus sp. 453mf TaxID=1761874 RepID=UPI0008E9EE45|nr:FAD-dependent monooxygenase [Paenibacillus sp. 453mf]SFS37261.1 2-polyprenyl-6-methoxyphenol hydroxylase [Paenibacillus sp. 453mf]